MSNGPTLSQWQELYVAAIELRHLAPWQWKHDDALFAVEGPDTAEIGYSSIMGALGEFHGLAVFPGEAGWRSFQLLRDDDGSYQAEEQRMFDQCVLIALRVVAM